LGRVERGRAHAGILRRQSEGAGAKGRRDAQPETNTRRYGSTWLT
jgi:hypothetical protein